MSRETRQESLLPLGFFLAWFGVTVLWWALAFFPVSTTPPEWLLLARQVCFGTTDTGLPESYGWLLLFLGPAPMLGFLLAMWGRQLWGNFHTLSRFFSGRLLIGLLIAVPLVGGLWVGQRVVTASQRTTAFAPLSPASPLPRDYPRLERPAPDFALLDQHGHTLSLAAQRGEVRILTFAFGHCSTICPTIVHTARAALEGSADVSPGLWVITLDPWRDTPGALPALAAKWQLTGEKMHLLSADIDTVLAVLNAYNMPQQRDLRTGDITHPALVYVIDANGRIAYAFNNPTTAWLIDALRRAARPDLS